MPSFCAVIGCGSRGNRDKVQFFRIPSYFQGCNNTEVSYPSVNPLAALRRKKWVEALQREDMTETKIKYGRICSRHFISGKPADLNDENDPDWVPTLNMGFDSETSGQKNEKKYKKRKVPKITPKEPSPPRKGEIIAARNRFKGILNGTLPPSDDDSEASDAELWPKNKRFSAHKRRNITDKENDQDGDKYVMKIFDRTLDLAQFNESTPLYPICRAWVANEPYLIYNVKKERVSDVKEEAHDEIPEDESDFDEMKDMHKLPPPEPLKKQSPSPRIPDVIPYNSTFKKEGEEPPSKDDLLHDNLQHWSKVRKSWREASLWNEARYEKSIRLLTAMYKKARLKFHN